MTDLEVRIWLPGPLELAADPDSLFCSLSIRLPRMPRKGLSMILKYILMSLEHKYVQKPEGMETPH